MSEYTTRSGSVLSIKAVPSMVIAAVQEIIPAPRVPTFRNEAKGRDEENPSDPEYIRAVDAHRTKLAMTTNDAFLANGVRVVSVGPSKSVLDSNDWVEGLTFVGLEVPDEGIGRRVAWLRWHILDDSDFLDVISAIAVAGGLATEEKVQQAISSFRDNKDGDTDNVVPFEQPS